jgi:hypothetical protein
MAAATDGKLIAGPHEQHMLPHRHSRVPSTGTFAVDFWSGLLSATLQGDKRALKALGRMEPSSVLAAAQFHGVRCLMLRSFHGRPQSCQVSNEIVESLVALDRHERAVELFRKVECSRVMDALSRAGISTLLMKGAALAYTVYPAPHLRSRGDTDILIRPTDREIAREVLASVGYNWVATVTRESVFTQWMFRRRGVGQLEHTVDLHWKVSNRPRFRDMLSFDESASECEPIASLGSEAKTFGLVHSLLLAAVHPFAHHQADWPLIWLYDILLLGRELDERSWNRFRDLAHAKRVAALCDQALRLAEFTFPGSREFLRPGFFEASVFEKLNDGSAEYLGSQSRGRELVLDLTATPGIWRKARLLASHVFPDVSYMQATYGASGVLSTGAAYTRRLLGACHQLIVN